LSYTGLKILLYTFLSKMFICFLSVFVSVQDSDAYVTVLSVIVFFNVNFSFFKHISHVVTFKYVECVDVSLNQIGV
jgi:hypothetical protein